MTSLLLRRPTTAVADDDDIKPPSLRGTIRAAALTIVIGFGSFSAWAFTAQLNAAATAPGVVMVESHRKTVQHLEGGIIQDLLVREGDLVRAGQVLIRLDGTQPTAQLAQSEGQYWSALARVARASAEANNAPRIEFPPELTSARERPEAAEAMTTQQQLFLARREQFEGQLAGQSRVIDQTREVISALKFQLGATREAIKLIGEELSVVREMVEKG
mgnify:FL=1